MYQIYEFTLKKRPYIYSHLLMQYEAFIDEEGESEPLYLLVQLYADMR